MKLKKKKKAMTLVEVMAALAITTILFSALSNLVIQSRKIQVRTENYLNSMEYADIIIEMFETKKDTIIINGNIDYSTNNSTNNYINSNTFKEYFADEDNEKTIWVNFSELNDKSVLSKALMSFLGNKLNYAYGESNKYSIVVDNNNTFSPMQTYLCSIKTRKIKTASGIDGNLYEVIVKIENTMASNVEPVIRTIYVSHI